MVVVPRPTTRLAARIAQDHPVQWRTAAPLWRLAAPTDNATLLRPAILRFTTDSFMPDFLTVATQAPQRLGEWQVQRETWRKPAPVPPLPPSLPSPDLEPEAPDPDLASQPLKLYQSAHGRYYLVTANLVCRIPGFPDRTLKTNNQEQVAFVLRRYLRPEPDAEKTQEYALVNGVWQALAVGEEPQLLAGEQSFPMFPVTYAEASGYQRRLFAGLVPVSARETYMNAGRQSPTTTPQASSSTEDRIQQLLTVLGMDVTEPWRGINRLKALEDKRLLESWQEIDSVSDLASLDDARDKLQTSSWYVLLDFAYYLERYLPRLWEQLLASPNGPVPADLPGRSLLLALQDRTYRRSTSNDITSLNALQDKLRGLATTSGATTLTTALKAAYSDRYDLERLTTPYSETDPGDWPTTKFLLCGQNVETLVDDLKDLVATALAEDPSALAQRIPLVPISQQISANTQETDYQDNLFAIRCVFHRPHCPPSLHPTVVSLPTEQFQMASYFDPDAPSRPIRIPMPVDTSPGGLRKFAKNTSFVISDSLSCQIEKARSLTFGDLVLSVLPWPFNKKLDTSGASCSTSGIDIGKICTLSIPIITICALILLIIFVLLLDIIFKWVPYLIFCLPLPGVKAKEDS